MKEKKELTKKELDIADFKSQVFDTIYGKMSVEKMISKFGDPSGVLKFAKVEVRYPSTNPITIIVDKFVSGELCFGDNITVKEVNRTMVTEFASSVTTKYIRHPKYNGLNMPKATQAEIKRHESKSVKG